MYNVKGSLRRHLPWWTSNVKNEYIVNVVAEGYRLPLLAIPKDSSIDNNKSARDHADFVDKTLETLLKSGVVQKRLDRAYISNPLTVASNSQQNCVLY